MLRTLYLLTPCCLITPPPNVALGRRRQGSTRSVGGLWQRCPIYRQRCYEPRATSSVRMRARSLLAYLLLSPQYCSRCFAWSLLTCTDSLAWRCTAVLCGLGLACVGQRLGGLLLQVVRILCGRRGLVCVVLRADERALEHIMVVSITMDGVGWFGWVGFCIACLMG